MAVPTDTVYGLAVDPDSPEAVARLFVLKGRPDSVPLPVLVSGWDQVEAIAGSLEPAAARLADRHWPGPLTLVVPRAPGFVADLGGPRTAVSTVGLRWPDHPVVSALCRASGPMAVTSANRHGEPPARTAGEVAACFSRPQPEPLGGDVGDVGYGSVPEAACEPSVLLVGVPGGGVPSTVVECRGEEVRCLREGALPVSEVVEPTSRDGMIRARHAERGWRAG